MLFVPAKPVPRMPMLPAPERSWALSSLMPSMLLAVPTAAVVVGSAPPPSVMLPPMLLITVPEPSAIAPAPLASRSELRTTFSALVVPTSAEALKTTLLSARKVSDCPPVPVLVRLFCTRRSDVPPVAASV